MKINLKKISLIFTFLLSGIVLYSCNLFSTRAPENPNTKRSSFQPPTTENLVVSNFTNSIIEKNVDNYVACFSDSTVNSGKQFSFTYAGDVNPSLASVFANWSINSEKQYFNTLFSIYTPTEIVPDIQLTNSSTNAMPSDSTIYTADYFLNVNHTNQSVGKKFSGTLQFVLYRNSAGLWSIRRWIDTKSANDSLSQTWSIIKALIIK